MVGAAGSERMVLRGLHAPARHLGLSPGRAHRPTGHGWDGLAYGWRTTLPGMLSPFLARNASWASGSG